MAELTQVASSRDAMEDIHVFAPLRYDATPCKATNVLLIAMYGMVGQAVQ
jgi:hypothetical protein